MYVCSLEMVGTYVNIRHVCDVIYWSSLPLYFTLSASRLHWQVLCRYLSDTCMQFTESCHIKIIQQEHFGFKNHKLISRCRLISQLTIVLIQIQIQITPFLWLNKRIVFPLPKLFKIKIWWLYLLRWNLDVLLMLAKVLYNLLSCKMAVLKCNATSIHEYIIIFVVIDSLIHFTYNDEHWVPWP